MSEPFLGFVHDSRMTAGLRKFIDGLREGKFLSTRCKTCGKAFMPPRFGCPCGGTDLEWFEVKPEGELYSWSIVHFAPEAIARKVNVPFVVGIIQFEDGLLLAGHMAGLASKPKVGMRVKVSPKELDSGDFVYTIKPV